MPQTHSTSDHNPLHHAAHYLKDAVTFESKDDEKRRESMISDHAHRNDHGGKQAEAEFWEKHRKHDAHGKEPSHGHVEQHEVRDKTKETHGKDDKATTSVNGTLL